MGRSRDLADGTLAELNVDSNTLAVDATNNRVGIGYGSPQELLHLYKTGGSTIRFQNPGTRVWSIGNDSTSFVFDDVTAGSERIRILSSGGLTFNGDTAAANALDDYEEGTWTPTLAFGGSSTGITYTWQHGAYVKIGGLVHLQAYLNISNKGSATGNASINGVPFPNTSDTACYSSHQIGHGGGMLTYSNWNIYMPPSANYINLSGGNPPDNSNAGITNSNFNTSGTYMLFTITYHTKS